jgi:hypothetical protein
MRVMKRFIARTCCLLMAIGAGSYLLLAGRMSADLQAALDKTVHRAAANAARHGPISTATKRIEQIRSGDMVMAADPASGVVEPRRVTRTFRRTSRHVQILRVRDSNGSEQRLETTAEHPFWVSGSGWRRAGDLAPGDRLVGPNGEAAVLKETAFEPRPEGVAVFNFEVEGLHTYFVAAQGVRGPPLLVHNQCDLPFAPLDDLVRTGQTVTREVASRNAGVLALESRVVPLATIVRWGREGLQSGDWVMKGKKSLLNWILSGKWQPKWVPGKNLPAKYAAGQTFQVPKSSLKWPEGFIGKVKGFLGQRKYVE